MDIEWKNLEQALNDFANYFIELARENLKRNNSIASRELYDSFEKIIEINEDHFSVKVSLADYWKYVENGRGPGKFPPPDKIREWVEVKPISIQPDSNGIYPSVEQVSFLIGRKIANEGTEAKPFFETAKEEAIRHYEDIIGTAIEKDIEEYILKKTEEMFKDFLK